jgi:branched-chain amino acid transport system ATP-binding protein
MTDNTILSVSDLQVSYEDLTVLRDINADITSESVVSILGANGAGKTTLLRTIAGLKGPDTGTITFKNKNILNQEPYQIIKQGLTYVPERHRIFPNMSVHENLLIATAPAEDIDRGARLEDVLDLFPILDERQSQKARNMSGGQQQMLALAQGLIVDPDTILLDEPTLGLAPRIVDNIQSIIESINDNGVTVILVDEKIEMAQQVSDEMYLMRNQTLNYLGERGEFEEEYNRIMEEVVGQ